MNLSEPKLSRIAIILVCIACYSAFAPSASAKVELLQKASDGKTMKVIKVALDGEHEVVTATSENGATFQELLDSVGAKTGVNGAYFCPADYPQCGGKSYTNADRVIDGKSVSRYGTDYGARGMFGFDADGKPLFILDNQGYAHGGIERQYNADKKGELRYGISNHPVLLLEGKNVLSESEWLIDAKMRAVGTKAFICSNESGNAVYMGHVNGLTITGMPDFLKKQFGCYQAIGLDSGWSLGLSYEGKSYSKPGRKIMDAFAVVPGKKRPTDTSSVAAASSSSARSKAVDLKSRIDRALLRYDTAKRQKYWTAIERKLREFLERDIPQNKKDTYSALLEMIPGATR